MMKNEVFLSFRGEETRKTFLSHLLSSLKKKDFTTFTSSETSPVSLQALQESLVAIPVISKNYASLDLWVDDLANIIECEKGTLTAVPIFFQLDPWDVTTMLRDSGKHAQSMQGLQRNKLETVKKWLDAHVINKTGFYSGDCKDDSELVGKVTSFVSDKLTYSSTSRSYQTSTGLTPAKSLKLADAFMLDPVAKSDEPSFYTDIRKSSCLEELRAFILRAKSKSTVVGICGVGGVGKTSLVRHVYGEISIQFQHHFFIKSRSLLQDSIKEMTRHRKVLLVADGVDDIKQIKRIIKDESWFGPGSRIIVITQERSLLTQCGVKEIYEVECPKHEEALALFSEFAFNQRKPLPGFEDLSFLAVKVSNRLPLSLKMLGLFLCDKKKDEWESTLRRLGASHDNYATEVCRYVGAAHYAPRRLMIKVDQHIRADEANRFPYYRFALK